MRHPLVLGMLAFSFLCLTSIPGRTMAQADQPNADVKIKRLEQQVEELQRMLFSSNLRELRRMVPALRLASADAKKATDALDRALAEFEKKSVDDNVVAKSLDTFTETLLAESSRETNAECMKRCKDTNRGALEECRKLENSADRLRCKMRAANALAFCQENCPKPDPAK